MREQKLFAINKSKKLTLVEMLNFNIWVLKMPSGVKK